SAVVVAASFGAGTDTWTVAAGAAEVANPGAPLKLAVIACVPAVSKVWARTATEPATSTGAPIGVPPSRNCTVPPAGAGLTVAAMFTATPVFAWLGAVGVFVGSAGARLTVTVLAAEDEPRNSAAPLYTA